MERMKSSGGPWGTSVRALCTHPEALALVVAPRGRGDRRAVGGRPSRRAGGSGLARRVGKGRAPFPRWAHRRVVGAGGGGGALWPRESPASSRGHHRPRKVAREEDMVSGHQPAPSLLLRALRRERS